MSEDKIKTNDVIRAYLAKFSFKVNVHNTSFTWSSHLDETLVLQRDQRTVYTFFNLVQKPKNHVFRFHKIYLTNSTLQNKSCYTYVICHLTCPKRENIVTI